MLVVHMLDVRDLRLIEALAKHGSMVRAARSLGVTQSAVTRALAVVEKRVGAILFDRSKRGLDPTDTCRTILLYCSRILSGVDELESIVTGVKGDRGIAVTIAAGPYALDTVVVGALIKFEQSKIGARLKILSGSALAAVREVRARRAALALVELAEIDHPEEFTIEPFRRHPVHPLARPGHPIFCERGPITFETICRYPVASPSYLAARIAVPIGATRNAHAAGPLAAFPSVVIDSLPSALAAATRSDLIVGATAPPAQVFVDAGHLKAIPCRPDWLVSNFGILSLRGQHLPHAAQLVMAAMREADADAFALAGALFPDFTMPREEHAFIGSRTGPLQSSR
jgi:DNA-binding transcriptional LysR family regulator